MEPSPFRAGVVIEREKLPKLGSHPVRRANTLLEKRLGIRRESDLPLKLID